MPVSEPGTYRAFPYGWGIRESTTSQSVAVSIEWQIMQRWDTAARAWMPYSGGSIKSDTWVILRAGNRNEQAFDNLREVLGWDGTFGSLTDDQPPSDRHANLVIEPELGNDGKTRMRVRWINPPTEIPRGGLPKTDRKTAQALDAKYNSIPIPEVATDDPDDIPF